MAKVLREGPLVSVVVPVRNAETTLLATLKSLESQSHQNWELLVTLDACTDSTREMINDWRSGINNAVTIDEAEGVGPSAARNLAAQNAQGDFLAFLDADDVWHPEKLHEQIHLLQAQPSLVAATCDYAIVNSLNNQRVKSVSFNWTTDTFNKWMLMEGVGPALCSTLLLRTQPFRDIGGFDADMWNLEDVDLALRLGAPEGFAYIPRVLCDYVLQPRQNHKEMATVISSITKLQGKPPFSLHKHLSDRLQVNLELLEIVRRFRRDRSPQSLGRLLALWAREPITVTRTVVRTVAR